MSTPLSQESTQGCRDVENKTIGRRIVQIEDGVLAAPRKALTADILDVQHVANCDSCKHAVNPSRATSASWWRSGCAATRRQFEAGKMIKYGQMFGSHNTQSNDSDMFDYGQFDDLLAALLSR